MCVRERETDINLYKVFSYSKRDLYICMYKVYVSVSVRMCTYGRAMKKVSFFGIMFYKYFRIRFSSTWRVDILLFSNFDTVVAEDKTMRPRWMINGHRRLSYVPTVASPLYHPPPPIHRRSPPVAFGYQDYMLLTYCVACD